MFPSFHVTPDPGALDHRDLSDRDRLAAMADMFKVAFIPLMLVTASMLNNLRPDVLWLLERTKALEAENDRLKELVALKTLEAEYKEDALYAEKGYDVDETAKAFKVWQTAMSAYAAKYGHEDL